MLSASSSFQRSIVRLRVLSPAGAGCSFEGPAEIGKAVPVDAARERARLRV